MRSHILQAYKEANGTNLMIIELVQALIGYKRLTDFDWQTADEVL